MDVKHCIHIKTSIGINREFLKTKKNENKSIFECLGKNSSGMIINDVVNRPTMY